jgi:hypothetical protein
MGDPLRLHALSALYLGVILALTVIVTARTFRWQS